MNNEGLPIITTIGLVDDHRLVRDSVKNLFVRETGDSNSSDYQITIEAENGIDLMEKWVGNVSADILLLDINMPHMDGYQTMTWVRKAHPDTKVIVLTMLSDIEAVTKMLKEGASGYLTKNASPEEILNAVRAVQAGGLYFTKEIRQTLSHRLLQQQKERNISPLLTDKELEILRLLATEMTYKEISEKLDVSPRTVDGYRESLFSKLGQKTRVGLVLYSMRNGIVDP